MKNKFRVEDDIAYIEINYKNRTAFETKVDASDLKRLLAFDVLWSVSYQKKCDRMYITTSVWMEGKSKTFYLHRFVTDAPKGKVVDHMNHNTLDNRKINLNVCTQFENQQNLKGAKKNSKSGVRGVAWDKANNKWRATIFVNGKTINLGRFASISEAEKVRKEAESIHFPYLTQVIGN